MDLEETLKCLKQIIVLLCKNLDLFTEFSEGKESIDFNISIEGIMRENMQSVLISFLMICYWLTRNGITPDSYTYLKEDIMLADIGSLGNLNVHPEIYEAYFSDKTTEYPEIDEIYLRLQNVIKGVKAADEKSRLLKAERVFKLFAEMLSEIYSKCGKGLDLKIRTTIWKEEIENAILDEIPEISGIGLGFWLKEEKFLEYLNRRDITIPEKIEYLSNEKKIPLMIIPESTLRLKSRYFYILSSWKEVGKMDVSELRHQHEALLNLHNLVRGFPPSVLLQDEVLEIMLSQDKTMRFGTSTGFWRLLIYSLFHMIADESREREELQFRFTYEFKEHVIDLRSEKGDSLLELPKDKFKDLNSEQTKDIAEDQDFRELFSSLEFFNNEYTKSLEISSLKKGWKIAFNEVLGFDMYKFIDIDNIHKIVDLYKKTVEKAFNEELEKLTDLTIRVEKSTLDMIDQIAKTINSISSEVHNSTVAVFGGLLVEILVVLSGKEGKLVWQLGVLLIFQFIVFYVPMVNRKIIGLVHSLLDTREVYEKSIDNSFEIMDLPDSGTFQKVRDFRKNVDDQWSWFEKSVVKEITFSRQLSIGLFFLLLFLISVKPDAPNNIIDFLIKNDVTFDSLRETISKTPGDFFMVLTPITVLIAILLFRLLWARKIEEDFLEKKSVYSFEIGQNLPRECSIYSSDRVLLSVLILYTLFLLNDIPRLLNWLNS